MKPRKRPKAGKRKKPVTHLEIMTPAFMGFMAPDAACGFEMWNGCILSKSIDEVTCKECISWAESRTK